LQVIGTARNGLEAVKCVLELKPDVVTLDIEMPEMNGLEALKKIMKERPTPTLMLSSLTQFGAHETIEALQLGAVDFIPKPSGSIATDLFKVKEELAAKIKLAAQVPVATLVSSSTSKSAVKKVLNDGLETKEQFKPKAFDQIVAIGTSTGGPRALEIVMTALPANFPYPVLVVQHMPPKFTQSLAQRLNRLSNVRVVEAVHNERLIGGTVYIAPGDYHMTVGRKNGEFRILLHQEPPRNGHRPSVDVLFESMAELTGLKRHYILMTGMGNDGAKGMLKAKQAGACSTIAESKDTCVVFGMPKSAIELNCVDYIVPVNKIAETLIDVTG
jgi:two-component system chemotaxis response regulator CheB